MSILLLQGGMFICVYVFILGRGSSAYRGGKGLQDSPVGGRGNLRQNLEEEGSVRGVYGEAGLCMVL